MSRERAVTFFPNWPVTLILLCLLDFHMLRQTEHFINIKTSEKRNLSINYWCVYAHTPFLLGIARQPEIQFLKIITYAQKFLKMKGF